MVKVKDRKGIALIAAYLVIMVLTILGVAFVDRGIYQNRAIIIFEKQTVAFDLAESGLDRALWWLRSQPAPPTGSGNLWTQGTQNLTLGTHTPPIVAGNYTINITDLGCPGTPGTRRYMVTSLGRFNNVNQTLQTYLQTDNYARYIWFTDGEDYQGDNVWFWTQDYLNGPTHTNGHFNIYGNPVFAGEVRSVDDYIRYYNNSHNVNLSALNSTYDHPVFQAGMIFGAEECDMPTQALNLRTASADSANGGIRLQGDTIVVLNSNGTMRVTNSKKGWNNTIMALPGNGALFVATNTSGRGGNLTISGTLSGRLTVGAARDIFIPSNITYANDPRINSSSTDTLGIISEGDIVIPHNASANFEIDGSMMALSTSFLLDNWDDGPAKGNLTVFGGIIQVERGPVGTFDPATGEKHSGYSKNYGYDARLLNNPPPFVPTTGDYVTLSWED